jgi:hypothetical protein
MHSLNPKWMNLIDIMVSLRSIDRENHILYIPHVDVSCEWLDIPRTHTLDLEFDRFSIVSTLTHSQFRTSSIEMKELKKLIEFSYVFSNQGWLSPFKSNTTDLIYANGFLDFGGASNIHIVSDTHTHSPPFTHPHTLSHYFTLLP